MNWITKAISGLTGYWQTGPAKLTDPVLGTWIGESAQSHAGKAVSVDSAMQIATAWACVRLLGQTVGTLPLELQRWNGTAMVPDREHPLWTVLHDQPNLDMSACEFWTCMGVSYAAWGNAYAEVHRTFGGRVVALTPLPPQQMTVRRDEDGALVYRLHDPSGARDLDERSVLHIRGLTLDGITGISPIRQAANTLGLAIAADETAGKLFANGMRTSGFLSTPEFLNDNQRKLMKARLEEYRGSMNAGRTPFLEGGISFVNASMPPDDAQLLSSREFSVEEIAGRVFGIPPWMVGHTTKSTSWGTGLQEALTLFHTTTLRPILKSFEGAIGRRLFAPAERGAMKAEFNVEGLLRGDSRGRSEFLKTMISAGVMTINEARAKESLPPVEGGDQVILQSNMLPLSQLGQATTRADLPTKEENVDA